MSGTIGWGILGCGRFMQRRVLPVFRQTKHARAAALQRRDLAAAEASAKEHGVPRAHATREALLADRDVQAVFIGTPNANHCADVLACAAAGKHVLVEKPMGVNAAECREMAEACAGAGVKLFVGHCFRYANAVECARAAVCEGALGPLLGLRGLYSFRCAPDAWRRDCRISGGGPLMDLAPHVIDFFRFVSGQEVAEVAAFVEPARDWRSGASENRARALLKLSGGAWATLEVSFAAAFRNTVEVSFPQGTLRADYTLSLIENPHVQLWKISSDPQPPQIEAVPLERRDIYLLQIEDISRALLDPAHVPLAATGEDGVRTLEAIDAVYEAAETGRKVTIGSIA
ncbi:MAG: hypothetical protein AMXMBFR7_19330 [Planctomycetota bacterium]